MVSIMEKEALEAPFRIKEQLSVNKNLIQEIVRKIKDFNPEYVMTVGRGTSDHAGVFAKYLIEVELGIPVCSAAPSVSSVYQKKMHLKNALVIFISQSGRSPDILLQAKMAKEAGAFSIALVNDEAAPIGDIMDYIIPLRAGKENAVAATKSYLATLTALLQLTAYWSDNNELIEGLDSLPLQLDEMINSPAQLLPSDFKNLSHLVVLGRGFGYAVSLEIALKLKEVCAIQAESFSSAEFFHGPVTLVEKGFTVVDIIVEDESASFHIEMMQEISQRGANILPLKMSVKNVHPRIIPVVLLQRFYLDVEKVAQSRGVNPDAPSGLRKVTKTL